MTTYSIKMPDIGEGIAEVELVAWRVAVGDAVVEDQILADVMTDKATVEIPSHVSGTVRSLGCAVGQVVPVGAEIIQIESAADAPTAAAQTLATSGVTPAPLPPSAAAVSAVDPMTPAPAPALSTPMRAPTPPAVKGAPQPDGGSPQSASAPGRAQVLASPAVRQRARTLGLDLTRIQGSGAAGQITHADLDHVLAQPGAMPVAAGGQSLGQPDLSTQTIAVIGLRRKIAHKMQEAKRRIPHFTYVEEVDVTELEALRAQLNAQHAKARGRLTVLPLLIRALVLAVREHPEVNARYDDDAATITRYGALHLGLATQTEGGLMVPVIRHAEALDLWACAAEISRLAEAARSGRASRDELSGSTLTLTSLGPLAGIAHTPVINHPEVAIVGPNRIVERPMVREGRVEVRKMMNVSSSFDHRVVDGMDAARFIQRLRTLLETPATLFVA